MEIEKLKLELAEAEAAVDAKREAENAEARRLAEIQAAVDAEEKRLNSKAYKDALKRIDELAIEADKRKQAAAAAVDELLGKIEAWKDVCSKHKQLAKQHRVEAKDLYRAEYGKLNALENELVRWKKTMRTLEALKQPFTVKPVNPKRMFEEPARKKMLKERYPDDY